MSSAPGSGVTEIGSTALATPEPVALHAASLVPRASRAQRLAALLSVLFVVALVFAVIAPWRQSVRAAGRVIAYAPLERRQPVQAPIGGRVEEFFVQEGTRVKKGDPLLRLSDNDPLFMQRMGDQRAALEQKLASYEMRATQLEAQATSLEQARESAVRRAEAKRRSAEQELRAAQQRLTAAKAALLTATSQEDRMRSLSTQGLASERDLELARLKRTEASTERASASAAVVAARAGIDSARAERAEADSGMNAKVRAARSRLASARSDVASAREALSKLGVSIARQKQQLIQAPRDGVVLRLLTPTGGALVRPGEPLLELVPDTDTRAVELWVDGQDAPLVTQGRRVRLQFEGWPAVQVTGWPAIAVGTFGGRVAFMDAHGDGKGNFRVVVRPAPDEPAWPAAQNLRQGLRVKGWVLLREVSFGYELWRLFNGFPPALDPNRAPGNSNTEPS